VAGKPIGANQIDFGAVEAAKSNCVYVCGHIRGVLTFSMRTVLLAHEQLRRPHIGVAENFVYPGFRGRHRRALRHCSGHASSRQHRANSFDEGCCNGAPARCRRRNS
jgi:hypothetical protein